MVLGHVGGWFSHNLFTYCKGNPVFLVDHDGTEPTPIIDIINWQADFSSEIGSYGPEGSIRQNGCGAIAIHNVNILMGGTSDFYQIVSDICASYQKSTILNGKLGTDPLYIVDYFTSKGDTVTLYDIRRDAVPTTHDAYIALFLYHDKGDGFGAHYTAGMYVEEKKSFRFFNLNRENRNNAILINDFLEYFKPTSERTYFGVTVLGITKKKPTTSRASVLKAVHVVSAIFSLITARLFKLLPNTLD